jgi:hypothetical protein
MQSVRRVVMDMSISHVEFFRILPAALGRMGFRQAGLHVVASEGARTVIIDLSAERPRRLGALTLPAVMVTIEAAGFGEADWSGFMTRFHTAFHRGGG